jgi:hypothetical protein
LIALIVWLIIRSHKTSLCAFLSPLSAAKSRFYGNFELMLFQSKASENLELRLLR